MSDLWCLISCAPCSGAGFAKGLPANAILGATTCLLADLCARTMFAPYVLHTGIMLDMIGGIVFILIVKRHYLAPDKRRAMR
ncbi:iron chelate uptake ABC transporter family permease subunit [uncultured Cohaesibacter sp.]|uniref:iron chelate uptake ABC transporter family permease subunit n=1 Tax=uncultured Cohaesibacter sp. TaxID=1002546 RepID=UPI0029C893D7|nr:iron chelate uptake ABC transporter family permease subunit [uncultured Cohaesibacter sp.]